MLRVLLEDTKQTWQVQAMAKQARVSLGLAFKVKQRLLDLEYAQEEDKGLRLTRPEELLRQWATNYSYLKSDALDCFAIGDPPALEQALTAYCRQQGITYALALFSGAARVAPFARYSRGFAYAVCDAASLAQELVWKPVPSGANFTILAPYDEGLLYGARQVNGDIVVSDIQLYLDLVSYAGRGEEAAAFILDQRLRPRW
ncbi:MAG: type IV toxin-antitoxin system AbiEi family antitoxin [Candidatus Methylomirabilis sp.]|nr:type IV toxin-antitoxin system AbiEi family antitoxin [Candidatus Methylomirabilis sp.]